LQPILIKALSSENIFKAAAATAALCLCALHFSPALASISLAAFFLTLFLLARKESFAKNWPIVILTAVWSIWQLVNQVTFGFDSESLRTIILRIPLLLLPVVWCLKPGLPNRSIFIGILVMGLFHAWIGGASVLNYFAHYRFLNQMVLESKPLPLFSAVYHIEFSLIMAVVILFQLSYLRLANVGWQRSLLIGTMAVNLVSLHVLSARTGILAFWVGVPFLLGSVELPIGLKGRNRWWLLTIPLLLLISVPSLRNRLINTVEDLTAVKENQNLGDKSFGRRWESWKISVEVIKKHPLTGVGFSGVEKAVHNEFEHKQTYLHVTDRIQPHNQYLQLAMQSGVVTPILLIVCLLWMIRVNFRQGNYSGLSVIIALSISMLFESYLERQSGAAVFALALFWVFFAEKKKQHFQ
jgi:O-antigen ligase